MNKAPRRSRLALALAVPLLGCACQTRKTQDAREIVGWVDNEPIHRSVVNALAEQEKLTPDKALLRAADLARLALAYRQSPLAQNPDPERSSFLRSRTAVRIWLREVFEAEHGPSTVPDPMVEEALEASKQRADHFRPTLHAICQLVVRPSQEGDPRQDPGFEARARRATAAFEGALQGSLPELASQEQCAHFQALAERLAKDSDPSLEFKTETLLIDLSQPTWDEDFVRMVRPMQQNALVPAFMTRFGLHLVYLTRIYKAHLPPESDGTLSARTRSLRAQELRSILVEPWRKRALQEELQRLRNEASIRWLQSPS